MGNKRKRKNYHRKMPVKRRGFEKIATVSRGIPGRAGYTKHLLLLVQEKSGRHKKKPEKYTNILEWLLFCMKITAGMGFVVMVSLVFIFLYDFSTQCNYFRAEKIIIKGIYRISEEEILRQAHIRPEINILSVNLSKTRKRLQAHPWIAEAEVRRELPSEFHIKITEHEPIAMLSLSQFRSQAGAWERGAGAWEQSGKTGTWGQSGKTGSLGQSGKAGIWDQSGKDKPGAQDFVLKFMINAYGEIFKKWNPSDDPNDLPLITGLHFSDINISGGERFQSVPYNSVMNVLRLGRQTGSIIPNSLIKKIKVDREMGITLQLTRRSKPDMSANQIREIKLGYNNYPEKYDKLKRMISYLKKKQQLVNINFIDLNNLNRIVVSECGMQNAGCRMQNSDI